MGFCSLRRMSGPSVTGTHIRDSVRLTPLWNTSSLNHTTTGLNHATERGAGILWLIKILFKPAFSLLCTGEREFLACERVGTLTVSERKVDVENAERMAPCWRNGGQKHRERDHPDTAHSCSAVVHSGYVVYLCLEAVCAYMRYSNSICNGHPSQDS